MRSTPGMEGTASRWPDPSNTNPGQLRSSGPKRVSAIRRRGMCGGRVCIHADNREFSVFDRPCPRSLRLDEALLHVGVLDRRDGPAHLEHRIQLAPGRLPEFAGLFRDDPGTIEEVLVFEQVRLEGKDLLDPQRPLLIPGARQAERFVLSLIHI